MKKWTVLLMLLLNLAKVLAQTYEVTLPNANLSYPLEFAGVIGGQNSVDALETNCEASFGSVPFLHLNVQEPLAYLRIFVESSLDTSLSLRATFPNQAKELACNDNQARRNQNPELVLNNLEVGAYDIYISSQEASQAPFFLYLTENEFTFKLGQKQANVSIYMPSTASSSTPLDGELRVLQDGSPVSTDALGEAALFQFSAQNEVCEIYLYHQTELSPCRRADAGTLRCERVKANVSFSPAAAHFKDCKDKYIVLESAIVLERGTIFSVVYFPNRELSLIVVFEGEVEVIPIDDIATQRRAPGIIVPAGYGLFTTPDTPEIGFDNIAEKVANLSERTLIPHSSLGPALQELSIEPFFLRIWDTYQEGIETELKLWLPDVVGLPLNQASLILEALCDQQPCMDVTTRYVVSEIPFGLVVASSPNGGSMVAPGEEVTLAVSSLIMPDLIGQTRASAKQTLENLCTPQPCLQVGISEKEEAGPAGLVLSTSPAAGEPVFPGSAVSITISIPIKIDTETDPPCPYGINPETGECNPPQCPDGDLDPDREGCQICPGGTYYDNETGKCFDE